MAEVTASMVKELRERTQAGMSDCKNALVEAGGDMDKAVEVIMKKGLLKGQAKAGKVATEGEVRTWIAGDKKKGVIVEVNCQTDFVARGEEFKSFVTKVTELASSLAKGADLPQQKMPGMDKTVDTYRLELVGKTGENMVVRRWDVLEAKEPNGMVHAYVHMGGKLAVLVQAELKEKSAEAVEFVDDVAMQIASMSPMVVDKSSVTEAQVAKQREIFEAQLREEAKPKPEAAWPKIIDGKVAKWFTEVALLQQDAVRTPEKGNIGKIAQELGVTIKAFVRFALGEGIEKKTDDLAAEVAKMTQA